jgi:hypothetical protein
MSTNAGSGGAVLDAAGNALNPTTTFHFRDIFNATSDNTFGGGLKWTDNPTNWTWTTSKASAKTDIHNVLFHTATDSNGHIWVVVAADRASNSGESYIDFEFLQNPLVAKTNGTFSSTGPNGGRTVNDILLSLGFTGGGSVADFSAWRWVTNTSGGGFMYVDSTAAFPTGRVFVAANTTTVPVPFGAFGGTTYGAMAFAEAAVDLTALLGNFDPCVSLGFKTIMVKTKTSTSSTATITDFINPVQYTLNIGPSANAGPNQTKCTEGEVTAFALNGSATPGLSPIESTTWSVLNGSAIIDAPNSLVTTAYVSSASATLRLSAVQTNGCTETSDIVLGVSPLPTCSISGVSQVCPKSSTQFSGPLGMNAYSWSISGNGVISGATNARTITVVAGNACGENFSLLLNVISNNCPGSCTTDVLVNDTVLPSLALPADRVLECPANTGTNVTGVATAQDDCSVVTVSYSDSVSNICGGASVTFRTWTAVDLCGNITNAVQTITVRDTTKPVVTCPPNRTLECPADTSTNATGSATASDTCSQVAISYTDAVSNNCSGTKVIARTWMASDACGNVATCVQTITVRDTIKPTLTCPPDLTLECPADTGTNATGIAVASDTCSAVTITYSDSVSNSCSGTSLILRTWTAADECNNSISCVQKITVRDTTKPTISCPLDLVLDCPADTSTNATGVATGEDTCNQVSIRYTDAVTNNCGGTKVISRTWTASDSCGNSVSCVQKITVRDITGPTITCPADLVLECPATTTTNVTGVATAQDTCGQVTIRYTDSVTNNCGGTKVIVRTWTATDACGNNSSCVQTITVVDTTRPSLVCPTNVTLDCPADTRTNVTGIAIAQDGCGMVTVTYQDAVTTNCGPTKVIARTWTATDACGNTTNCVQTITVRDINKPSITCPANVVLECPANTSTNATGIATASDTCSQVVVTYADAVSNTCGGSKIISRTWTATDACGNSASCVQTITVRDTTKPTLTCPQDLVLECPAVTTTNATGVATAQDACSQVTVTYSDSVSNSCSGTSTILRTWTATDACNNSISCVQRITVRDTAKPTINCPANVVLECPANTSTNATGVATAQDSCSQVTIQYSDSVTNNCGGTKVIARTWTAIDACGNSVSCVQTITVRDTIKPTLVIPTNLVLECPATDTRTNVTGAATAQDGCGTVSVSYSDSVTTNCGATKVIARTWTATDACGNVTNGVQTITVRDTVKPTISCPADVVLECPANTSTNVTGVATGQDACSQVTIRFSDSTSGSCAGTKIISRTWTATDACGNSSSCVQTITVRDTVNPTISKPADLVVECGASTAPSATGTATAQDACGSVSVTYSDSVSNNCGGSKVISRTWTAVDQCGNTVSALQTITVRDTTAPSLKLPANLVQQCPGDTRTNVTGVPVVTDACGGVTVSYSDVTTNGCGLTRTVQRLWTAVDQCGNATNGLQTISVIDTTKPGISCPKVAVQCVDDIPSPYANLAAFLAAGGSASDSCSSALTFAQVSDSGLVGRCPGTVTRVYRVTDACGNFADCTQTITVDDTIAPALTCPASLTVECGNSLDPASIGRATATDNCSTNVVITYSDTSVQSQYDLKFYVADPDSGTGPYGPTYMKFAPGSLPCPESAILTGRALDPLRNAVAFSANGQLDALTSIGNVPMAFGQIVPFEAVIQPTGGPGPEHGKIEFTADWHTYTTSNNRFGYDTNYMVYCAFVDAADPGSIDPNFNARVDSFSSTVVNRGTIEEAIRGTFRISGLDAGDRVVVEIWVVLQPNMAEHSGGTVAATLVSAQTLANPPAEITIGTQTDSLGNLGKIFPLPAPQQQPPLGPLPPQPPVLPGTTVDVIDRTWAATDECGNRSTCVQRITVRDTAPPVLTVADVALECPANDTSTNVTGTAIVQDCSTFRVYYTDVVTNICPGSKIVYRTWTAIDDSGNSTNRVQTITVQDSTAPTLTCSPNRTVPVTESWTFTEPTVSDACSSATVQIVSTVTNRPATSTLTATRTWIASDACGNSKTCQQTITVLLGEAPVITAYSGSQTAVYGGDLAMHVAVSSQTPCSYQWRVYGNPIPGANANSLLVQGVQFTNAGVYSVSVNNAAGTALSPDAVVNVVPKLMFQSAGGLTLSWPAPFILQAATILSGPYIDVPGASSPFKPDTSIGRQGFFRLRSPEINYSLTNMNGMVCLTGLGVPGCNFAFQASTDLVSWINLQTNVSPFVFMDTNSVQYPNRFYRAVVAH